MIRKSFQLLERIGPGMEQKIWQQGVRDWNEFLKKQKIKGISDRSKAAYDKHLRRASCAIQDGDSTFFNACPEPWRLYNLFRDEALYLDIEVTGVNMSDDLLMIGLFDGIEYKCMMFNNMDLRGLSLYMQNFKLLVSFNGSRFDVPFMKKRYPGLLPDIPHIDVEPLCRRRGLTGGLKAVEKSLGIKRSRLVERMYSGDVNLLWRKYRATGDDYFLKLLIEYNSEDVMNLPDILTKVIPNQQKQ